MLSINSLFFFRSINTGAASIWEKDSKLICRIGFECIHTWAQLSVITAVHCCTASFGKGLNVKVSIVVIFYKKSLKTCKNRFKYRLSIILKGFFAISLFIIWKKNRLLKQSKFLSGFEKWHSHLKSLKMLPFNMETSINRRHFHKHS